MMVTASYKQVLGKKSHVNSSDPGDAQGTMSPLFRSSFRASAARLAPEAWLHPRDT